MPSIQHITIQGEDGFDYALALDFDDSAIMEDSFRMVVRALKFEAGDRSSDRRPIATLKASVSINPFEGCAEITLGENTYSVDLASAPLPPPEAINLDRPYLNSIAEPVGDSVRYLGHAIENLVDALPSPDPFMGCMIKGGLSASIGQAVECYTDLVKAERRDAVEREEDRDWWERKRLPQPRRPSLKRMFRCMRRNGLNILGSAAKRAGRCALTLGLF